MPPRVIYTPGLESGIAAGAVMLLILLIGIAYFTRLRRGRALLQKLPHRRATCVIDEQGVHLENTLGSSHLEWRILEKIVPGHDVGLVFGTRH